MDNIEDIIIFSIAGKLFCIDLRIFDAVLYPSETGDNDFDEGRGFHKITFNGENVNVADFAGCMGVKFANPEDQRKILLLKKRNIKVAIYADSVLELISFGKAFRKPVFSVYSNVRGLGIIYEVLVDGKIILMPEFEMIINLNRNKEKMNKDSKLLRP
jgi:chemotaxis signal transduction protein